MFAKIFGNVSSESIQRLKVRYRFTISHEVADRRTKYRTKWQTVARNIARNGRPSHEPSHEMAQKPHNREVPIARN